LLLAKLFNLRPNDILRVRHLPFLEVDATYSGDLIASDIGRSTCPCMI
jgi:hypothetical protein